LLFRIPLLRSQLDQRPWQSRPRAIEEEAHPQRLCALHRDKLHLPANMIDVLELHYERLVDFSIPLEPSDPVFNALPKSRADLIAFIDNAVRKHGELLGEQGPQLFPLTV
jgi:hypothetical protein